MWLFSPASKTLSTYKYLHICISWQCLIRAGNFCFVNVQINAWSQYFINMQINLIFVRYASWFSYKVRNWREFGSGVEGSLDLGLCGVLIRSWRELGLGVEGSLDQGLKGSLNHELKGVRIRGWTEVWIRGWREHGSGVE